MCPAVATPRVLLAQELGMGMWHAVLLKQLARAFRQAGASVILAVADPVGARHVLADEPCPLLASPNFVPPVDFHGNFSARTFGDIIGASGWHDRGVLAALLRGWDDIVDLVKPDIAIVDHSPSARLALRGRLPVCGVGLGFTSPPPSLTAFPPLTSSSQDAFDVEDLLANANYLLDQRGVTPLEHLPALFGRGYGGHQGKEWVTCLPELDPYRQWRTEAAIGPLEVMPEGNAADPREGWVAYLSGEVPEAESLLLMLASVTRFGSGRAFVRNGAPAMLKRLEESGIDVCRTPIDLTSALQSRALVVHHGGTGTIHQAAIAGCPQLLLPRHLEQAHNAQAVVRCGAGVVAQKPFERSIAAALAPKVAAAANSWAMVASAQIDEDAAELVAAKALALCRQGRTQQS